MIDEEIKMVFELLKGRIDQISRELQQQAADQILASDFISPRKTITKIENINRFKDKIKSLEIEWELIENDHAVKLEENKHIEVRKEESRKFEDHPISGVKKITLAKEGEKKPDRYYNLDYHLGGKSKHVSGLFHELRKKIKEMAPNMREEYNKMYISFVDSEKFCEIHVQKNQLKIWLPPAIEALNDPQNRCRDVRSIGHYGTGASELSLWKISDIEGVFDLIRQSYDLMKQHRY